MKFYHDYLRELDKDTDSRPRSRRAATIKRNNEQAQESATLSDSSDNSQEGFNPSFHSSRHEREWILTYLGPFYNDHIITDVLRQVKGGKEATVYCCAADPDIGPALIAAKVYRPRMFRSLRNDSLYREGQTTQDTEGHALRGRREKVAMAKKTRFGQDLRHMNWLNNEFETLERLHAAGADVPRTYAFNDNAILMDYLGDEDMAAPALIEVRLDAAEAHPMYERLMENIELMLAHERIHGDLSAHNILYWEGRAVIIDFPQAVSPLNNSQALVLLTRDIERVGQYFARYGIVTDAGQVARRLWQRYVLADNESQPLALGGRA